jgi:hypothetical protein
VLSERARRRALEIANDADLRIRAPRTRFRQDATLDPKLSVTRKVAGYLDSRLPPPGSYLEREYKGRRVIVKILVDGFEFNGQNYRSLSAIAKLGALASAVYRLTTPPCPAKVRAILHVQSTSAWLSTT